MNKSIYVGRHVSRLDKYEELPPISGVVLVVENVGEINAGDESGYVLRIECKYGTQQIADDILNELKGKVYKGYRAEKASMPPEAELGDSITIDGTYSMLAYQKLSAGPGNMSEIAAPGQTEASHEYQYVGTIQRQVNDSVSKEEFTGEKVVYLINESDAIAKIIAKHIQLEGLTTINGYFKVLEDGSIEAVNCKLSGDLEAGTLNGNNVKMSGDFGGLMQGTGQIKSGTTTKGIVIYGGKGVDDEGNAIAPYLIVTDGGVRIQDQDDDTNTNWSKGRMEVNEIFAARGQSSFENVIEINLANNIRMNAYDTAGEFIPLLWTDTNNYVYVGHNGHTSVFYGKPLYINDDNHETKIRGSTITSSKTITTSSDKRLKKDITVLPDGYDGILDNLLPVLFRYKSETDDAPLHMGYIAQDVQEAMKSAGVKDDLTLIASVEDEGGAHLALAYEELIPILHRKIQTLEERIKKLETKK